MENALPTEPRVAELVELTPDAVHSISDSLDRDLQGRRTVLNCRAALERLEGDCELFRDLLGFFFADTPRLLSDIRSATVKLDADALRRASHAFKGLVLNFDAKELAATAQQLELMGRDGELGDAQHLLQQLVAQYAEVESLLRRFVRGDEQTSTRSSS